MSLFQPGMSKDALLAQLAALSNLVDGIAARLSPDGIVTIIEARLERITARSSLPNADLVLAGKGAGGVSLRSGAVTAFRAVASPAATEHVEATAGVMGVPASVRPGSAEATADLIVGGKGPGGTLRLAVPIGSASTPAGFVPNRIAVIKTAAGEVLYLPASTVPW